ncbi:uncharacterized protein LOC100204434 isoform X3 [Hydra vulgaris]
MVDIHSVLYPCETGIILREYLLVGMENPLLDISAVCDEKFLLKYDLKSDSAILADEKHLPLYKDMVDNLNVEFIPGGAALNSMRVAQWILQKPNVVSYFGCIGDDDYGRILVNKAYEAGVNIQPQINKEYSTGTCAVLITGTKRSLVANLSAANQFKRTHFDNKENWDLVEKAEYFYIGGFFLTVSPESILEIANYACDKNKCVILNLSADFICQFFGEALQKCLPYVDVLFGNDSEAISFSKLQNFNTEDVKEIALKTAALGKINQSRSRIVVFTCGAKPSIVAYDGKVSEYHVTEIKQEDIVDTNGAGDSFVGGFLSQFIQRKCISRCVQVGHYAANYIIQQSGVSLKSPPVVPEPI